MNDETVGKAVESRTKQEASAAPERSGTAPHGEPENARNVAPDGVCSRCGKPAMFRDLLQRCADCHDADPGATYKTYKTVFPSPGEGELTDARALPLPQIASGSITGGDLEIRPVSLRGAIALAAAQLPENFLIAINVGKGLAFVEVVARDFHFQPERAGAGMTLTEQLLECFAAAKAEAARRGDRR